MTASPALADGYRHRRHHDRIGAGEIFAGLLMIGGIAAIASAASKSRDRDAEDRRAPYPGGPYDQQQDDAPEYGDAPQPDDTYRDREEPGVAPWRDLGGRDEAVDICADEIERGDRRIDTVDTVSREGEGYRVEGRMADGSTFACGVGEDGRIRRVAVGGQAI